jgi:hypothetical protein
MNFSINQAIKTLTLNAYQNSNNTAISLQGGAGFRF